MTRFRKWPQEIRDKVKALQHSPGVYQMKGKKGRILYVGKALSLRDRVSSYFNRSPKHGKNIEYMLSRLEDFDVLLTRTESEAFILEANLVKQFQPPYNILLKDDKQYPYIRITTNEAYPRLQVTRIVEQDGCRYFGPYTSVSTMRRALKFIANLFNLRTCALELDGEKFIPKPCLDYHLKLCSGPCADLITKDEYAELTRQAIDFFSGKEEEVRREIEERMHKASEDRRYEAAARLRDILFAVKRTQDRQTLWGEPGDFFDVLGYSYSENRAVVLVLPVRAGRLLGEIEYLMENELGEETTAILEGFIQQYYSNPQHIQPQILIPEAIESAKFASDWLSGLAGRKVTIHSPARGRKRKLVEMAMENAAERLRIRLLGNDDEFVITPAMKRLQELLGLPFIPRRIEGFDISHTRGTETVGSMVVFTDGKPDNAAYRSFTIKGKAGGDDLKAMSEVIRRRLYRYLSDDKWFKPDSLILIDGGRTQLDAVLKVVKELRQEYPAGFRHDGDVCEENGDAAQDNIEIADSGKSNKDSKSKLLPVGAHRIEEHPLDRLSFASLAKREETLNYYDFTGNLVQLHLGETDPGLSLAIAVRDESHRRAQRHHHARRDVSARKSSLEEVPGLGENRTRALLSTFKSLKKMREASVGDLAAVKGMTMSAAVAVKKFLMEKESFIVREWRVKEEIEEMRRKPRLVAKREDDDTPKNGRE